MRLAQRSRSISAMNGPAIMPWLRKDDRDRLLSRESMVRTLRTAGARKAGQIAASRLVRCRRGGHRAARRSRRPSRRGDPNSQSRTSPMTKPRRAHRLGDQELALARVRRRSGDTALPVAALLDARHARVERDDLSRSPRRTGRTATGGTARARKTPMRAWSCGACLGRAGCSCRAQAGSSTKVCRNHSKSHSNARLAAIGDAHPFPCGSTSRVPRPELAPPFATRRTE